MSKNVRRRRPSPALVISIVALFAALGGTAYAGSKINGHDIKPHTIGGNKLKSKSVGGGKLRQFTGGLLKRGTVGRGKMKLNNIRGPYIDESTLDTVPSAEHAERVGSTYSVTVKFGQFAQLAEAGPFKLVAQCLKDKTALNGDAHQDIARVYIATSEANSVFDSEVKSKNGKDATDYLQPNTPGGQRIVSETAADTGKVLYEHGGDVTAYAPSGAGLVSGHGSSAAAVNLYGGNCTFNGVVLPTKPTS